MFRFLPGRRQKSLALLGGGVWLLCAHAVLFGGGVTLVPIAVEGQAPPGGPPNSTFGSIIERPFVGPSGGIGFTAGLAVYGPYWSFYGTPGAIGVLAGPGGPTPGFTDGTTLNWAMIRNIDASGRVLTLSSSTLAGGSTINGLLFGKPGSLNLYARSDTQALGAPAGVNYGASDGNFTINGRILANNYMAGAGVTAANDQALFAGTPDALTLMARVGDHAPGMADGVVFTQLNVAGINAAGQSLFNGSVAGPGIPTTSNQGVWIGTPGSVQLVGFSQTPILFRPNGYVGPATLNHSGQIAYASYSTFGPSKTIGAGKIWYGVSGSMTPVVNAGDPVPGLPGLFTSFSIPHLTSAGHLLFYGDTNQTLSTINSADGGLFEGLPGALKLVVRNGTQAPGLQPRVYFKDFYPLATNRRGQFAFLADLTGPGVVPGESQGIWASFAGQIYLVAAGSQLVDLGNGETAKLGLLQVDSGANGENGLPATFNDLGQLVFNASVGEHVRRADFFAQLPTTIPGDANLDGIVDRADFKAFNDNFGQPGDLAHGDFNADGRVDFKDFQILELNYGRAVEPLPPDDASFAQAGGVPEPGALGLLAAFWPFFLRRTRKN